jgi:predicted AAA+ superfamily ATPase
MYEIDQEIEIRIRNTNPWWQNIQMLPLPPLKRWAFEIALKRLKAGMTPAVALRGPRQVGKTTLTQQIIQYLLDEGVPPHQILRVQFEDLPTFSAQQEVILDIAYWFEHYVLGKNFHIVAHEKQSVYIFLDELQNVPYWSSQLKYLVDNNPVRVMITGSSALQIEIGQDSLAGRLSTIEMGPLFLREIAALRDFGEIPALLPVNGLSRLKAQSFWQELREFGLQHQEVRHAAFAAFSERGAYPIAHLYADVPWEEMAVQLNETIIRRVIQHDLRISVGEKGLQRDEKLLEEVFRFSCRYMGQTPKQKFYLEEIKRAMGTHIDWQRILTYLHFLESSLLLSLVKPLEIRLKRPLGLDKLCICDHALRASWLQKVIPLTETELSANPHLSVLAGHIAESIVGYFMSSLLFVGVAHFPERAKEPEVDFILTVGDQRIPIEVKYRKQIEAADLRGLIHFIERPVYDTPFGLLITQTESVTIHDPRIVQMPLSTFLLMR